MPNSFLIKKSKNCHVECEKYQNKAKNLKISSETTEKETENVISLLLENEKVGLTLLPSDFLYAEAADNYSLVCYRNPQGVLAKELLRVSLSKLLEQLHFTTFVKRCHRSYLVNLKAVCKVEGNAQGYKLYLSEVPNYVPVSRSFMEMIVPFLEKK
jgi:DNA-binding LytR/AlgR family response regulator